MFTLDMISAQEAYGLRRRLVAEVNTNKHRRTPGSGGRGPTGPDPSQMGKFALLAQFADDDDDDGGYYVSAVVPGMSNPPGHRECSIEFGDTGRFYGQGHVRVPASPKCTVVPPPVQPPCVQLGDTDVFLDADEPPVAPAITTSAQQTDPTPTTNARLPVPPDYNPSAEMTILADTRVGTRKLTAVETQQVERSSCVVYQYVSDPDILLFGVPWTVGDVTTDCTYPGFSLDQCPYGTRCYDQGYGWVAIHPTPFLNTQRFRTTPVAYRSTIDGYKYYLDDKKYSLPLLVPGKQYTVVAPFYAALKSKFRAHAKDTHLENACRAFATSQPTDDERAIDMMVSTSEFYVALIKKRQIEARPLTEERVYTSSGGPILGLDRTYMNSISATLERVDVKHPARVPAVVRPEPNHHDVQYLVRNDFTISGTGRCDKRCTLYRHPVVSPCDKLGASPDEPQFVEVPMHPPSEVLREQYSTVFGKLHASDTIEYESRSNSNMYASLGRLIAAKVSDGVTVGELECRRNAMLLGMDIQSAHVAHKFSATKVINPLLWPKMALDRSSESAKLEEMLRNKRAGPTPSSTSIYGKLDTPSERACGPSPVVADHVRRVIAMSVARVVDGCNRSTVQKWLDSVRTTGSWVYNKVWAEFLTLFYPFLSRDQCAMIKHVKQRLRRTYVNGVRLHYDDDLMVKELDACVKREIAKAGKKPRFVAAYGAGCMYSNELPELVKICMDGEHTFIIPPLHDGGTEVTLTVHIMAKPRAETLSTMFRQLHDARNTPNTVYAMIFSDDAVYSGNVNGEPFMFNADVSSNDSSQDTPAFLAVALALGRFSKKRAKGLVKQCMLPIRVRDKEGGDGSFAIKFAGPFEGSGTVLTTILNHFGSLMIAVGYAALRATGFDVETSLREGAGLVGHTMTMDVCSGMSDVLFLKRYPVLCGDQWVPQIAGGTLLKRFGSVEGDLTHQQLGLSPAEFDPLQHPERFQRHQAGIMLGWKHEPSNPLMKAMREKFVSDAPCVEVLHDSLTHVFVDTLDHAGVDGGAAFRERYNLDEQEIIVLQESINLWSVGVTSTCSAVRKIMKKDYDM